MKRVLFTCKLFDIQSSSCAQLIKKNEQSCVFNGKTFQTGKLKLALCLDEAILINEAGEEKQVNFISFEK